MGRGAQNLNNVCAGKIFFVRRDLNRNLLAGDCAVDKNNSTIGQAR